MTNLSEAAKRALVSARAREMVTTDPFIRRELSECGLIGTKGALTQSGSIAAAKAKREAEDKAFG